MTRWLAGSAFLLSAAWPVAAATAAADDPAHVAAGRLHRGVNVLGYDPVWKDPAHARFQPRHFTIIRRGGFDFIRLVLQVDCLYLTVPC